MRNHQGLIPWFPSCDVVSFQQLGPQQTFDVPRRCALEMSFLLILFFRLSFWVLVVEKAGPWLSYYPLWCPYILPTLVPSSLKPLHSSCCACSPFPTPSLDMIFPDSELAEPLGVHSTPFHHLLWLFVYLLPLLILKLIICLFIVES